MKLVYQAMLEMRMNSGQSYSLAFQHWFVVLKMGSHNKMVQMLYNHNNTMDLKLQSHNMYLVLELFWLNSCIQNSIDFRNNDNSLYILHIHNGGRSSSFQIKYLKKIKNFWFTVQIRNTCFKKYNTTTYFQGHISNLVF